MEEKNEERGKKRGKVGEREGNYKSHRENIVLFLLFKTVYSSLQLK